MAFADRFDVGSERKREKSQGDSKLFGLRTQKDDVPQSQYLPANSLLSWVFCLSVSLSSEGFFDHV